ATLAMVRIPDAAKSAVGQAMRGSLVKEMGSGFRFIAGTPGLFGLLTVVTIFNFGIACEQAVLSPFLLSFTSVDTMGLVLTVAFSGMIVGTVIAGAMKVQ